MAESRIIKRNVRFWGKSGLQLTGIMLIFMVVYGFLFNMGSGSIFGDFWKTAYFYGGIISVLFALIGSISYVGAYLPMALSFWIRKKGSSLWGTDFLHSLWSECLYHSGACRLYEQRKVRWKAECTDRCPVCIYDSGRTACIGCADAFRDKRNDHRNRHCGIMHGRRICDRNWIH